MSVAKATAPRPTARQTVILSARVDPDVRAGLEEIAEATGLTMGALLVRAVELLRADPSVGEIAKARTAWNKTLHRARASAARARTRVNDSR